MGTRENSGFTIIETVLFLAVTGLLVLGMLVGVGTSLNNQRYRDAVETFKTVVQQQYADLGSVRNGRSNTWTCSNSAQAETGGSQIRGQSNCVIVGKYLRIDQSDVMEYTVLAYKSGSGTFETEIQNLSLNYTYNISSDEAGERNMEWGTSIAWPKSGTGSDKAGKARSMSLFIMRSPESGNVYTFTGDEVPAKDEVTDGTFKAIMKAENDIPGQGQRTICINSAGLFVGDNMALQITAFAAGSSAVEIRSNETLRDIGGLGAPQC